MSKRIAEAELRDIEKGWEDDSVHRRTPAVPALIAEVRRLRGIVLLAYRHSMVRSSEMTPIKALVLEGLALQAEAEVQGLEGLIPKP